MKIRYASDLHVTLNVKYCGVKEEDIIKKLNLDGIDLLILAGDTDEYPNNLAFCQKLLDMYPKLEIIEIGGNHLYYSGLKLGLSMEEIDQKCRDYMVYTEGRYFYLNNDSVIINGTKFIGSTMWTDLGGHFGRVVKIVRALNDFRYILNDNLHEIYPQDIIQQFEKSIKYIIEEVNKHKGKSIVITHHTPFIDYDVDYYKDISHAFGIDLQKEGYLDKFIQLPYKWIFGHNHVNKWEILTTDIGNIDCICNQFGYKSKSEQGSQFTAWKTFDSDLKLDV